MTENLERRVEVLEAAVLALGIEEFGDVEGHPFHGNQWTGGSGGADNSSRDSSPYGGRGVAAKAAQSASESKFLRETTSLKPGTDISKMHEVTPQMQELRDAYGFQFVGNEGKATVKVDWASESPSGNPTTDPREIAKELKDSQDDLPTLRVAGIKTDGPGGGWPEVKIEGDAPEIDTFLDRYENG